MDVSRRAGDHGFGVDGMKIAAQLRKYADDIESGEAIVQEAMFAYKAVSDDYRADVVTLSIITKKPKDETE